jgi:hypothetical protein
MVTAFAFAVCAGAGCDYACIHSGRESSMKFAGMLLLLAGWGIVVSAVALFARSGTRGLFVLAGLGVELLGLVLAFRGSANQPREAK